MYFFNRCFDKNRLKALILWLLNNTDEDTTLEIVEKLKDLGFQYATKAGLSLSIDDLKIPPRKDWVVSEAGKLVEDTHQEYLRGRITSVESIQQLVDTWHRASEILKKEVIHHFQATDILNPVYMMAFSGARGNISQVRQLVGMRGLMADPQGQIIGFPIRSNFKEGLTVTEYMISCYGARKGLVDTALRTADAGYLTRRLVDVSQHVVVRIPTCATKKGIFLKDIKDSGKVLLSLKDRLIGRVLSADVLSSGSFIPEGVRRPPPRGDMNIQGVAIEPPLTQRVRDMNIQGVAIEPPMYSHPNEGELVPGKEEDKGWPAQEKTELGTPSSPVERTASSFSEESKSKGSFIGFRNQEISPSLATKLAYYHKKILVRSPLTCSAQNGICQMCYGWSLSEGRLVTLGEAVGIVAAQSIGEPGTQLTMRTFHTGGVFSGDVLDEIKAPFPSQVFFNRPLEGVLIRTPHGKIGFLTRNKGQIICKNRSSELGRLNKRDAWNDKNSQNSSYVSSIAQQASSYPNLIPGHPDADQIKSVPKPCPPSLAGGGLRTPKGEGPESGKQEKFPPIAKEKEIGTREGPRSSGPWPAIGSGLEQGKQEETTVFQIERSTILFVRQNENVPKDYLLAESSSLQSQTNERAEAKKIVFSDISGQVFFSQMVVGRMLDKDGQFICSSRDLGSIWILAGQSSETSFSLPFYKKGSHLVNKSTLIGRAHFGSFTFCSSPRLSLLGEKQKHKVAKFLTKIPETTAVFSHSRHRAVYSYPVPVPSTREGSDRVSEFPLSIPFAKFPSKFTISSITKYLKKSSNSSFPKLKDISEKIGILSEENLFSLKIANICHIETFGSFYILAGTPDSDPEKSKNKFFSDTIFFPKNSFLLHGDKNKEKTLTPTETIASSTGKRMFSYSRKTIDFSPRKKMFQSPTETIDFGSLLEEKKNFTKKELSNIWRNLFIIWFSKRYVFKTGGKAWWESRYYNDFKGGSFLLSESSDFIFSDRHISLNAQCFYLQISLLRSSLSGGKQRKANFIRKGNSKNLKSSINFTYLNDSLFPFFKTKLSLSEMKTARSLYKGRKFDFSSFYVNNEKKGFLDFNTLFRPQISFITGEKTTKRRWVSKGFPLAFQYNLQGLEKRERSLVSGWAVWEKNLKNEKIKKEYFSERKILNLLSESNTSAFHQASPSLLFWTYPFSFEEGCKKEKDFSNFYVKTDSTSFSGFVNSRSKPEKNFFSTFGTKIKKKKKQWKRNPFQIVSFKKFEEFKISNFTTKNVLSNQKKKEILEKSLFWSNFFSSKTKASPTVLKPNNPFHKKKFYDNSMSLCSSFPGKRNYPGPQQGSGMDVRFENLNLVFKYPLIEWKIGDTHVSQSPTLIPTRPYPNPNWEKNKGIKWNLRRKLKHGSGSKRAFLQNYSFSSKRTQKARVSIKPGWIYIPKNSYRAVKLHKSYNPIGTGYWEGVERSNFDPWTIQVECLPRIFPWSKIFCKDIGDSHFSKYFNLNFQTLPIGYGCELRSASNMLEKKRKQFVSLTKKSKSIKLSEIRISLCLQSFISFYSKKMSSETFKILDPLTWRNLLKNIFLKRLVKTRLSIQILSNFKSRFSFLTENVLDTKVSPCASSEFGEKRGSPRSSEFSIRDTKVSQFRNTLPFASTMHSHVSQFPTGIPREIPLSKNAVSRSSAPPSSKEEQGKQMESTKEIETRECLDTLVSGNNFEISLNSKERKNKSGILFFLLADQTRDASGISAGNLAPEGDRIENSETLAARDRVSGKDLYFPATNVSETPFQCVQAFDKRKSFQKKVSFSHPFILLVRKIKIIPLLNRKDEKRRFSLLGKAKNKKPFSDHLYKQKRAYKYPGQSTGRYSILPRLSLKEGRKEGKFSNLKTPPDPKGTGYENTGKVSKFLDIKMSKFPTGIPTGIPVQLETRKVKSNKILASKNFSNEKLKSQDFPSKLSRLTSLILITNLKITTSKNDISSCEQTQRRKRREFEARPTQFSKFSVFLYSKDKSFPLEGKKHFTSINRSTKSSLFHSIFPDGNYFLTSIKCFNAISTNQYKIFGRWKKFSKRKKPWNGISILDTKAVYSYPRDRVSKFSIGDTHVSRPQYFNLFEQTQRDDMSISSYPYPNPGGPLGDKGSETPILVNGHKNGFSLKGYSIKTISPSSFASLERGKNENQTKNIFKIKKQSFSLQGTKKCKVSIPKRKTLFCFYKAINLIKFIVCWDESTKKIPDPLKPNFKTSFQIGSHFGRVNLYLDFIRDTAVSQFQNTLPGRHVSQFPTGIPTEIPLEELSFKTGTSPSSLLPYTSPSDPYKGTGYKYTGGSMAAPGLRGGGPRTPFSLEKRNRTEYILSKYEGEIVCKNSQTGLLSSKETKTQETFPEILTRATDISKHSDVLIYGGIPSAGHSNLENSSILSNSDYFPYSEPKSNSFSLEKGRRYERLFSIPDTLSGRHVSEFLTKIPRSTDSKKSFCGSVLTKEDQYNLSIEQQKPTVSIGQLLHYGEEIAFNIATAQPGQIVAIDKNKICIRKGQAVLFYSGGLNHVSHGQFVAKNSPLLTLTYQKLITGDIVQGIPKIEQFFEAPVTKDGEPLSESLGLKLRQAFHRFRGSLSLPLAARQSVAEIQEFVVEGIQKVYLSQGVLISDKHIEIIVRQMTSKGKIVDGGNTGLLPGEYISLQRIESINLSTQGRRADYEPAILGITQASLDSESFISAASFQETTRVLSRDSLEGKTDFLRGLKERVVLGDLIQAGTGLDENLTYGLVMKEEKEKNSLMKYNLSYESGSKSENKKNFDETMHFKKAEMDHFSLSKNWPYSNPDAGQDQSFPVPSSSFGRGEGLEGTQIALDFDDSEKLENYQFSESIDNLFQSRFESGFDIYEINESEWSSFLKKKNDEN